MFHILKYGLSFGLLIAASMVVLAQNPKQERDILDKFTLFHHYTLEQGLSSNTVSSMVQDEDGFLWIGTSEGLNRFDGTRFTPFFRRTDGQGLPYDDIGKIISLPKHRLLIATWKGLCVMDTRRLTFTQIPLPLRSEYAVGDQIVWDILRGQDGKVWVGTGTAIHLLDEKLKLQHSFYEPQQAGKASYNHFAREFIELPDGTVAVKCMLSSGIQNWQVVDFEHNTLKKLGEVLPFCGVLDSAKGFSNVWVERATNQVLFTTLESQSPHALMSLDWQTKTSRVLLANNQPAKNRLQGQFSRPFPLPDNWLLMQPSVGELLVFDRTNGKVQLLDTWHTVLQNQKDITYFLDRNGNLWICPQGEGIYFLPLKTPSVKNLTAVNAAHQKAIDAHSVPENWLRFFCYNGKDLQIFTAASGGFYVLNKNTGDVTTITDAVNKDFTSAFDPMPFNGDTLCLVTRAGNYWFEINKNTHGLLRGITPELEIMNNDFLFSDSHGLIWGGVKGNGIACFDVKTRQFRHFQSQGNNPPFPIGSANEAAEDSEGNLWFCSRHEETFLVKWTRATGVFEKIKPTNKAGKTCAAGRTILMDKRGDLWIRTSEEGVFCINTKTLEAEHLGKEQGLSTNNPRGMCIDKFGNIWLATPMGLSRYNPELKHIRTFYQRDGLLSNGIMNVSLLDTSRNILMVSTDKGLCLFDPSKVMTTEQNPKSFITAVSVSADSSFAPPESGILTLKYTQNDVSFDFSSINFYDGSRNRYQFRLDGADEKWRDADATNKAIYLNLPHGNYTFRVRTANSDGVWSQEEARLVIKIYPPFWQTWTFRLLLLAALGGLAWWLYQRQIRLVEQRENEKNEIRQQLADLEMKALRSQMNPHFVFNALNSVQNFILKNDPREASRYLTKFARLMRLILENSESPVVALSKEIELLRYYTELEVLRFNKQFVVDFQIDPALNTESVNIPGMLIQPHIENAIWHGLMHKTEEEGRLTVRFQKVNDQTIICEIEDNGVGRAAAAFIEKDRTKSHRSTGLANIRHRLELLNAQLADDIRFDIMDLYDAEKQAIGTKVVVRMPIILRG